MPVTFSVRTCPRRRRIHDQRHTVWNGQERPLYGGAELGRTAGLYGRMDVGQADVGSGIALERAIHYGLCSLRLRDGMDRMIRGSALVEWERSGLASVARAQMAPSRLMRTPTVLSRM